MGSLTLASSARLVTLMGANGNRRGIGPTATRDLHEAVIWSPYNVSPMDFELVGDITDVETIAAGRGLRDLPRLRRLYGKGHWRKMKGKARIRLRNGRVRLAELHWYEAHGIGKKEFKRKRYLD